MALLDIFKNINERLGKRAEENIGGLLGVKWEDMSEDERKMARRLSRMAALEGLASGGSPVPRIAEAAQLIGAQREQRRQAEMQGRAAQDIQQAQAAIAGRLGARGADVGEQTQLEEVRPMSGMNLQALLASPAGAAAAQANPQLAEMLKQRTGQQVVGGSIYDRETGRFITPPKEKAPKVPVREVDLGNVVQVYYSDGSSERLPKGLAPRVPAAGPMGPGGIKPTKGQEDVDKKFADTIADYVAAGGYADVEKQITQLEDVAKRLRSGEQLSGPVVASLMENYPNLAAAYNSGAIDVQELVAEVAQRNLRAILGGQFAQQEGMQLIKRAYNPALKEEVNAKRVESLIASMRKANQAKNDAIQYWNRFGTLAGYEGNVPTTIGISDVPEKKAPPAVGEIRESGGSRFQYLGGDPANPSSWKKL